MKSLFGIGLALGAWTTTFFANNAFARVEVDRLPAPKGYRWNESAEIIAGSKAIVLSLIREVDGRASSIRFAWDSASGFSLVEQRTDPKQGLVVPKPGRDLYAAHPDQEGSLEEAFLKMVASVRGSSPLIRFLKKDDDGKMSYSTIDDFIDEIEKSEKLHLKMPLSSSLLQLRLLQSMNRTQKTLLAKTPFHSDGFVSDAAAPVFEAIQPVISHVKLGAQGEKEKIDAFVYFPLETYQLNGSLFLAALEDLRFASASMNILDWLESARSRRFDKTIRMAVLALFTHNHYSEEMLIRGAIASRGTRSAWTLAKSINEIYANEWDRLISNSRARKNPKLRLVYPPFKGEHLFLSEHFDFEIPVTILSSQKTYWIPIRKMYHFYGGIVAFHRLQTQGYKSNKLNSWATLALGLTYKVGTAGYRSPELATIKNIYLAAGYKARDLLDF